MFKGKKKGTSFYGQIDMYMSSLAKAELLTCKTGCLNVVDLISITHKYSDLIVILYKFCERAVHVWWRDWPAVHGQWDVESVLKQKSYCLTFHDVLLEVKVTNQTGCFVLHVAHCTSPIVTNACLTKIYKNSNNKLNPCWPSCFTIVIFRKRKHNVTVNFAIRQ